MANPLRCRTEEKRANPPPRPGPHPPGPGTGRDDAARPRRRTLDRAPRAGRDPAQPRAAAADRVLELARRSGRAAGRSAAPWGTASARKALAAVEEAFRRLGWRHGGTP